ncbi:MAG: radical SAM protein [Candidatus Omnitrophica bacterium]|nr:radical SAM protein [Candidatus Omnitrophota bacterium]
MNVVLINPSVQKVVESRYDRPVFPHLGLGYIASYLRSRGVACSVLDAKMEGLSLSGLLGRLKEIKPHLVGLTSMTHEIGNVHFVAKRIKESFPGAKIALGGVHATFLPLETLRDYPEFDFIVSGEGEETFFDLYNSLSCGKPGAGVIAGLSFLEDGTIKTNPSREKIHNLDGLPFPAWESFPLAKEYPVMTSRGCPFECIFCANPNGRVLRARSAESVVSEFEWVVNTFHPQRIVFWDEGLTFDRRRAESIFDSLIKKGLHKKVRWYAQTHVSSVDYLLCKKMKEAGCVSIGLGIESGNERILSRLRKKTSISKIEKAVKDAKRAGLPVEGYFIFGHPHETKETALDTLRFAVRLNPEYPVFGIMVPYPGTEVLRMAQEGEGDYRLLSRDWSDYNKQLGHALELTNLNRRQLELFQLKGYMYVFICNVRLISLARFFFRYRKEALAFLKKMLLRKDGHGPAAV